MKKNQCPYCNSAEISKPKYSRKAFAISVLLLGFPLFLKKKVRFCFDCSRQFENK